ncbi:MAG: nucleotidyltransferase family protein [Alphaproteobacteria bacterium]|nr:nucleotidyltransferase family protein [Alphaproteobacteria bacterium]
MSDHLKYAGADAKTQRAALETIIRSEPVLMDVLEAVRDLRVPDGWLVSGAIYNLVWNRLTDRPSFYGVNDIDVIYFDDDDLSWDAEDRVIRLIEAALLDVPVPVQPRNQARVHLWYEQKFGIAFAPLTSACESLERYASKTHAIAARLDDTGALELVAPFGLDDLFAFRVTPNTQADSRVTHTTKGARIAAMWPEVTVVPWPE